MPVNLRGPTDGPMGEILRWNRRADEEAGLVGQNVAGTWHTVETI